jgi:hypothetical protein
MGRRVWKILSGPFGAICIIWGIFFFFSFFFYYSYVHTRLGSFLPPAPTPSQSGEFCKTGTPSIFKERDAELKEAGDLRTWCGSPLLPICSWTGKMGSSPRLNIIEVLSVFMLL